jgi:hypothetical protein
MLLSLVVLVPVAAAAEPWSSEAWATGTWDNDIRDSLITTGTTTIAPDQDLDLLVVLNGTTTVHGDVESVILIGGSADLVGGHVGEVVAIGGRLGLDAGSVVERDVRVVEADLQQAAGATVGGRIIDGVADVDWALVSVVGTSLLFVLWIGLILIAIVGGLVAAAVASRQLRRAGDVITREPGLSFVAGLAGVVGLALLSAIATITVVGIPVGLTILFAVLPLVAFVGFLITAVWIGEWIVARTSPGVQRERPYLAAVLGVLVLSGLSLIPFVGGMVSFFGIGAALLLMWRSFRGEGDAAPASTTWVTPAAG